MEEVSTKKHKRRYGSTEIKNKDNSLTTLTADIMRKESILELIRHGLTPVQIESRLGIPLKEVQAVRDEALLYYSERLDDHQNYIALRNYARLDELYAIGMENLIESVDEKTGKRTAYRLWHKNQLDIIKAENQMVIESRKNEALRRLNKPPEDGEFVPTLRSGTPMWEEARDMMDEEDFANMNENFDLSEIYQVEGVSADFDDIELESMAVDPIIEESLKVQERISKIEDFLPVEDEDDD